ncbi:hypothetical protein TWF192_000068 [Orbilia oligospora]|uniref:BTB domain-containing protein n=1 Tax=Orbilia oligospora TaxID=2813651 RepID=A0A6G1MQX2_ORBOL|nr:hypothetical protein TWF191_011024 [Orbilia oligospora]KAF3265418.1 hypothetical protein TWF192_000068 [Orbilia oligospora]
MVVTRAGSIRNQKNDEGTEKTSEAEDNHPAPLSQPQNRVTLMVAPPQRRLARNGQLQAPNRLSWMGPAEARGELPAIDLKHTTIPIVDEANHDMTIVITFHHHRVRYLVSKNVLSLSSPTVNQLLQTNVQLELIPGVDMGQPHEINEYTMHLNGNPKAMQAVLMMLHLKGFDDLFNISFELFTEIAILCARYGWQDALRPWVRNWLDRFIKNILKPGHENWLYASKIFKCEKRVDELISTLANEVSTPSECGIFIFRREKRISKALWPAGTTDQIVQLRNAEVARLTAALRSLVNTLKNDPAECRRLCPSDNCVNHALGSLVRSVQQNNLSTLLDDYNDWPGSVVALRNNLCAISYDTLDKLTVNHTCALNLLKERFMFLVMAGVEKEDGDAKSPSDNQPFSLS